MNIDPYGTIGLGLIILSAFVMALCLYALLYNYGVIGP